MHLCISWKLSMLSQVYQLLLLWHCCLFINYFPIRDIYFFLVLKKNGILVFCLYGWLSSPCVVGTHRGQKRVLESLGAEL